MNNYMYETIYYVPLFDFLNDNGSLNTDVYIQHKSDPSTFENLYKAVFNTAECPVHFKTGEVNELWCKYIVPQHFENIVAIAKSPESIIGKEKKFFSNYLDILDRTLPKYKVIISNYEAEENRLMDALQTINTIEYGRKDNATYTPNLDTTTSGGIKNSDKVNQTTKLNTTPAELGDFTGDAFANQVNNTSSNDIHEMTYNNHKVSQTGNSQNQNIASGIDKNTITSEKESKMARLNEIHDKWINVFNEWADEFKPLFMVNAEVL